MANQTLKKLKYDNSEVQVESAIRDGNGNTITSTYAKKSAANTFSQSQTIQGTTTSTKLLTTGKSTSSGATGGLYGKLGSNEYLLIGYGSSNLWIGANETAGTHHSGSTYISTGQGSRLKASALINGTRTNKDIAYVSDLDNVAYTNVANTFTQNQTINGELYVGDKTAIYTSGEGGNFRIISPNGSNEGELDYESNVLRLYALYGATDYTEMRLWSDKISMSRPLEVTKIQNPNGAVVISGNGNGGFTEGARFPYQSNNYASWMIGGETDGSLGSNGGLGLAKARTGWAYFNYYGSSGNLYIPDAGGTIAKQATQIWSGNAGATSWAGGLITTSAYAGEYKFFIIRFDSNWGDRPTASSIIIPVQGPVQYINAVCTYSGGAGVLYVSRVLAYGVNSSNQVIFSFDVGRNGASQNNSACIPLEILGVQ